MFVIICKCFHCYCCDIADINNDGLLDILTDEDNGLRLIISRLGAELISVARRDGDATKGTQAAKITSALCETPPWGTPPG